VKKGIAQQKQLGATILAIALAALLLVTACAPAPTAEGRKVTIAGIWTMTGPGASEMLRNIGAVHDYIRYFQEQKAIPGVSIELLWGDTGHQYALFLSHYERFVTSGVPLIFTEEDSGLTALKARFEEDEIVVFVSGSNYEGVVYPPGRRYFCGPTIPEQFAVLADYFMENWKEERPPRLAFAGIDSAWGYEPRRTGTEYAESLGFEVLAPEVIPFVPLDTTTQLLRLKESGADFVYIQALVPAVATVLRDAERLGLLGQMQFSCTGVGHGEGLVSMAGAASEGVLAPFPEPWFDEIEVPGVKLMLDTQIKYHGEEMRYSPYFRGWVSATIVCEAVSRAMENVGYENLDGRAIKEALDGFEDFDVYGLTKITYTDDDHRGSTHMAIYQVQGGKIVRVSDWREAPTLVPEK